VGLKLSQTVIMSDVDGTLLHTGAKTTSSRNLEALNRYTSRGGRLAIATGRSLVLTRHLAEALPVNFPCIIFNGGGIYDFQKDEYLSQIYLPKEVPSTEYARQIRAAFPDCGTIFINAAGYFDIDGISRRDYFDRYPNPKLETTRFDDLGDGSYFKVVFLYPPDRAKLIYEYAQSQPFGGVRFVFSDNYMLEMLPANSSKGAAMAILAELAGVSRENMIAIGDYFNDFEMIEYAGIGVTLSDAPEEIKAVAQMIVCPCVQDSLADLIERLEAEYEY